MNSNRLAVSSSNLHQLKNMTTSFILVPDENENIFSLLKECATVINLSSALVSGIGSIKNIELGFYDHQRLSLEKKLFHGIYEIASLSGSITYDKDTPFIHLHGAFSDITFQTFGGHMIDAQAGSAIEIYISPLIGKVNRIFDEHMKIKRIYCP